MQSFKAVVGSLVLLALALPCLAGENSSSPVLDLADGSTVRVILAGSRTDKAVRYSVTILKPAGLVLPAGRVEVDLPSGAELVSALETPGRTRFAGWDGKTLVWSFVEVPGAEHADPLTFVLRAPARGPFAVRARFRDAAQSTIAFEGRPPVPPAGEESGEIVIGPKGTDGRFVPIGRTGLLVAAAPGLFEKETSLHLAVVTFTDSIAAPDKGWWSAGVDVSGLPEGAWIRVLAPLSRPLPPQVWLPQWQAERGGWTEADGTAQTSFDGQYAVFLHRGGVLTAFAPAAARPEPADGFGAGSVDGPLDPGAIDSNGALRFPPPRFGDVLGEIQQFLDRARAIAGSQIPGLNQDHQSFFDSMLECLNGGGSLSNCGTEVCNDTDYAGCYQANPYGNGLLYCPNSETCEENRKKAEEQYYSGGSGTPPNTGIIFGSGTTRPRAATVETPITSGALSVAAQLGLADEN